MTMRDARRASLVALCGAALLACDSGGGTTPGGGDGGGGTPDAGTDATTPDSGGGGTDEDAGPGGPDMTGDTGPSDTTGPGDDEDTQGGDAGSGDAGGGDAGGGDTVDDDDATGGGGDGCDPACGEGESCEDGTCVATGGSIDYEFSGHATYLHELNLPTDDSCCFDFNDDGSPDNGLGGLLGTIGDFGLDFDISATIQENLQDGSIAIVFEETDLDDDMNDDGVGLNGFLCTPADENGNPDEEGFDYDAASSGGAKFLADAESFEEGTNESRITFDGSIDGGVMTAGPSLFELSLPLQDQIGFDLDLSIQETQMETETVFGPNADNPMGLEFMNGKLGGVVPLQDLVDALNGIGETCDCFGLGEGENIMKVESEGTIACTSAFESAGNCSGSDESICSGLGGQKDLLCGVGTGVLSPDIDTDGNGTADSFSIGLTFSGTHAELVGITGQQGGSSSE